MAWNLSTMTTIILYADDLIIAMLKLTIRQCLIYRATTFRTYIPNRIPSSKMAVGMLVHRTMGHNVDTYQFSVMTQLSKILPTAWKKTWARFIPGIKIEWPKNNPLKSHKKQKQPKIRQPRASESILAFTSAVALSAVLFSTLFCIVWNKINKAVICPNVDRKRALIKLSVIRIYAAYDATATKILRYVSDKVRYKHQLRLIFISITCKVSSNV